MLAKHLGANARVASSWARTAIQTCARRQAIVIPLGIALVVRLVQFVGANAILRWGFAAHHLGPARYTNSLDVWQQKDTSWYLSIAISGYGYSPTGPSNANFFPLFPMLMSAVGRFFAALHTRSPYLLAGILLSWALFAVACVTLYHLALLRFEDRRIAIGAVTLLAVFPFSFYYGAAYTESLYLALGVGAFLAAERRQWWIASALAMLASASRPPGLLIGACVALAYLLDWRATRHPLRADLLALALTPLGTLAYLLYCWRRFGDPLAYIKTSHAGWGGGLQLNGLHFIAHVLAHPIAWLTPPDLIHSVTLLWILLALAFLAATPFVYRLLGPTYALFAAASILAPVLDFSNANSLGRYLSVIFPVFLALAYLLREHPRLLWSLSGVCLVALVGFAACFIAGYGLS
ncbi:MAG TPA: mannosyltransferase family protein [Ktedonobacterales bacterium]